MKNKIIHKIVLVFVLFSLLTSCVTKLKPQTVEPFGVIGANADLYIYLPVENNEVFIDGLLGENAKDKNLKIAINKTKIIHSGVFQKRNDTEIRVCTLGMYPKGLTDAIFQAGDGWTRKLTVDKYKYYESSDLDVSIPHQKFAFLLMGQKRQENMELLLSKISNPEKTMFSADFDKFISVSAQSGVAFYSSNPNYLIGKLMGMNLGLPVKTIEMYFFDNNVNDKTYTYSLIAETNNSGTTFALAMLLSRMMDGKVITEDYFVKIENAKISYEDLSDLLKDIY